MNREMQRDEFIFALRIMHVELVEKLLAHTASVYAITGGGDDHSFFTAGGEGVVVRWNVGEWQHPVAVAKVEGQVFALLFLPRLNHLLVGTMQGGLHVIDLVKKQEIHHFTVHNQSIFDIKKSGDEIFVCAKDGLLSVWSIGDYQLRKLLPVSKHALRVIAFHPQGKEAAIGSSDNNIYRLNTGSLSVFDEFTGPENSVFSLSFINQGHDLLAGSRDAQLYCYDLARAQLKEKIKAHLYTINHIEPILDGAFIATASRDKTIRIWDAREPKLVKSIDREKNMGHSNSVNRLLWLHSCNQLISVSDDRAVLVWSITD